MEVAESTASNRTRTPPMGPTLDLLQALLGMRIPEVDFGVQLEIILWLVRANGEAADVVTLYRNSRFSEPTLRRALKEFVERGWAELWYCEDDARRRAACPTGALLTMVHGLRAIVERIEASRLSN